ncbi:Phototropin-2 [Hordeum vulgare]|nr:Phototropin-2 [Hordeum vulgare]
MSFGLLLRKPKVSLLINWASTGPDVLWAAAPEAESEPSDKLGLCTRPNYLTESLHFAQNCRSRFLQGSETDQTTVDKIREAIREQKEVTVQLINYTKSGKKFWNLFHLQPMWDQKGEHQYFIGLQLDGSNHVEPLRNRLSKNSEIQSAKLVKATTGNVDEAVRELPDANLVSVHADISPCRLPALVLYVGRS